MFVTLWHKPKKEQSTMLIQAENSCQFLNVSYVTNVVPKLYDHALELFEKETPSLANKKKAKGKALQSPRVTRTTKKVGNTLSCKLCVFASKNVSLLNEHMISVHKKKALSNKSKEPEVTPYKPPTLSATQLVEISCEISKNSQCFACGKRFENYEDLSKHEKEHHELPCKFCNDVFFTKTNLNDHIIKIHVTHHSAVSEDLVGMNLDKNTSENPTNLTEPVEKYNQQNMDYIQQQP